MVFQRYLDPNDDRARTLSMYINNDPIEHWNPFCENESKTEKVAEETKTITYEGKEGECTIRAFILPRREYFSSPENLEKARLKNDYQGIYIYREDRLIHYRDWLGIRMSEPHLTLLRVEFSFDHLLDEAFQVDIKKSKIQLSDELYNWVRKDFLPAPLKAAEDRYRDKQKEKANAISKGAHEGSNNNISSKEDDVKRSNIDVIDAETGEVSIDNKQGKFNLKLIIKEPDKPGQCNIEPVGGIDDGLLWKPVLIGGHHAAQINTGHPYYHKVYIPNIKEGVTIQGMDSLLWSLVEAEFSTVSKNTEKHFEELRYEVSRILRKLVEDLPDPKLDDE